VRANAPRRPLFRSRFVLAASVGLLFFSNLWLTRTFRPSAPADSDGIYEEATERNHHKKTRKARVSSVLDLKATSNAPRR
jgi:hypothetical protein